MPDGRDFGQPDPVVATGGKQRSLDIIAAVKTLITIESEKREATPAERDTLRRFGGFGAVSGYLFPDPVPNKGHADPYVREGWKSASAKALGTELAGLLSPAGYASARRTTFNAFYTSPPVMRGIFHALDRMGVPHDAHVLEPGCGIGRFPGVAPEGMRFTGVEMDDLSGRIARAIHPRHDIRIENFRDTVLKDGSIEAAVGNVPFADIPFHHNGEKFSLHDGFFAKTVDALAPGGVLGLVTSRYTLDKINGAARDYLADRADLLGAIRLPDEAFKDQGTKVVTDIVFLRKRHAGEAEADPAWRGTVEHAFPDGRTVPLNAYFAAHPEMILGEMSLDRGMHNAETLRVRGGEGYPDRLAAAIGALPHGVFTARRYLSSRQPERAPVAIPTGLGEGSFFIGPDKAILQVEAGEALPVMFGAKAVNSSEGVIGRRLAKQIALRDAARLVLRSQNEGWPDHERDEARTSLNRAYDSFVAQFGPLNKVTISATKEGGEIRRMPNLGRFREDPDAFLVMSLEDYDDSTGKAAKAPIMQKDVVGPIKPVGKVASAEEGLLVSLNERGKVDLGHISRVYGQEPDRVVAELGDLIYHDPESGEHVTRDAYLSGNVRRKLVAAQASADPRHKRNVTALEAVQPADLLPGEIDANLGAPWIPRGVIREFVADLVGVEASAITVMHLPKDAAWSVDGNWIAKSSVANTSDYGTGRIDALSLVDQALNMKSPTIYDIVRDGDGEKRILNQPETVAAREKQKRIKQRFAGWIFDDPERAESLVRLYNDGFNNIRLREFDGSHLTFPGMSSSITMRPHQVNSVWRVMTDGNTLLAHCVGAGKTMAVCASAMKLKQAGLVRSSLICCPNHMLEQFGREFYQLYPNAKILVAGKEDLARDRRKLLTAKIATGDWDAVIMTHSSFERVGMSPDFQCGYLQEEIDAYGNLLVDTKAQEGNGDNRAHRNILKHLEKRKAAFEDKLKALAAEKKKDDGLVFDDLGVDQIFTDELHHFKNADTPTKMDRVAGIQTQGSQRAFDMMMKAHYLHGKTPGRGFVGATGTPISNTMVEMYTMMRYLAPGWLRERGMEHFDAWAASFGEVVDTMEISPDGSSLRPNSRFAKFVNLPELQQGFRSFADVQTADMLKLPVPKLKGGKPSVVTIPMGEAQAGIQTGLVERYERIRRGGVDPRDDNALAITTDGRKLALDARLVTGEAADDPNSKINAVVENVVGIWRRSAPTRGTQMIFCDIGVNPTAWGFSVYQEIKDKLARSGIPSAEIADIGDANTDAKKEALFERMREGRVRVLLGSTAKMGTGTNVQKRLIAKHDLDAPWKPADIEQRDGRIMRQGNTNPEVEIYRYVTEGSFDAFMWQGLERKARFISQIMKGDSGVRKADDIGGQELSFAEVKAIASGNPAILTLAEMEAELQRLSLLKRSHADDQYRARRSVKDLPDDIERVTRRAEKMEADYATAEKSRAIVVAGRTFGSREKATDAMNELLKHRLAIAGPEISHSPIGSYRGLELTLETRRDTFPEMIVSGQGKHFLQFRSVAAGSLLNRIDDLVASLPEKAQGERQTAKMKAAQLEGYRQRVGLPFDGEAKLDRLNVMRNELEGILSGKEPEAGLERTHALVAEFNGMKDAPAPELHVPEVIALPAHPARHEPAETVVEAAILPMAAAEHPQHRAEILPFALVAAEPPAIERAAERMEDKPRPRLLLSQSRHPVHQGSLFDAPRRVPIKASEQPVKSWTETVGERREKPKQLALF